MARISSNNFQPKAVAYALMSFNGISILGNVISEFAMPWLILKMTDSPSFVGIILALKFIPAFFSSLVGGQLIDRVGRYKISQYADFMNFITIAMIPLLFQVDQLDLTILAILVVLSAMMDDPGRSAKDVIFARHLKENKLNLEHFNGMNGMVENLCDMIGPMIAGMLILYIGFVNVLWVDAVSFLIPIIGLYLLAKHLNLAPSQKKIEKFKPINLLDGLKFLGAKKETLWILFNSALISLILSAILFLYLPIFAIQILKAPMDQAQSMLFFALGTTASSFLYARIGSKINYKTVYFWGLIGLASAIILLGFAKSVMFLSISLFIIGICLGFTGPLEAVYLQKNIADEKQGRAFSTYYGLRQTLIPIFMPLIGLWIEYVEPMILRDQSLLQSNLVAMLGLTLLVSIILYGLIFKLKS